MSDMPCERPAWRRKALRRLRELRSQAVEACKRAAERLGTWWRSRLDRLSNDPGYAEALVTVFLALANLLVDSHRIRAFALQVTEALLAFIRAMRAETDVTDAYWA